jgi:hypothetical protein
VAEMARSGTVGPNVLVGETPGECAGLTAVSLFDGGADGPTSFAVSAESDCDLFAFNTTSMEWRTVVTEGPAPSPRLRHPSRAQVLVK